ncbi:hypothetical protein U1Q18_014554, partial [Sarracenia purpurea var. burkii]
MNISQGKLSNKFKALELIDSDEYDQWFPALESSEGHRSNPSRVLRNRSSLAPVDHLPSGRSLDDVFRDVAALRHDLLEMVRDQSLNPQGKRTILAMVKKLETEEKCVRGPPFDSARLTNLEARIRRLNKIKESAIRDSQAASDAQEKFDKMEKVVKEVRDGSLASLSPCPVASEGKCAKERDEEDEEGDQDKVFCCDSNMSPGDLCCVVEVSEEAPVSTILQAVHTEGLSDSAHQVFDDMPHPVSVCKPADKRDTNESDEDEDVEDCDDESSSIGSDPSEEEDSGIAVCPQVTNTKGVYKEQIVAGASKTWAHVVAKDTLPHVMPRLSSLSSKIDLVDLGIPNNPNVLEIEGVGEGLGVQDNSPIPVIFPALETVEGSEVELKKEVVGLQGGEMEDVSSELDGSGSAIVGGLEQVAAVKQGTGDSSLPTQMSSVRGLLSDLTIPSSRGLDEYVGLGNKGTVEQETKKAPKVQFYGDCAGQVFSPNLPFRSVFIAGDCCEGVDLMRSSGGASMDKQTGDWVGNLSIAHQVFDKLSNTPKPNEMSVSAAEKHPSMCKLKSEAIKKVSDIESAGATEDVESSEEQVKDGDAPAAKQTSRSWANVVRASSEPRQYGGITKLSQRSSSGLLEFVEPKE